MKNHLRTVAIVEDDTALREALCESLAESDGWRVSGSHRTAEEAIPEILASPPDAVLMDIQLPGMSGIECVRRLKAAAPDLLILMVTVYDNSDRVFDALAAGASGYLLKRDAPTKLIDALEDAVGGGSPMSSAIARKVVQHFQKGTPPADEELHLTQREKQTLDLLIAGCLYKEIAAELGIGVETVRFHLQNIYKKLHVRTRTEAVVKYLRKQS